VAFSVAFSVSAAITPLKANPRERAIRIANTMNPFDILLIANTPFTLCCVLGRGSEFKLFSRMNLYNM
jgi:hypothetical protein